MSLINCDNCGLLFEMQNFQYGYTCSKACSDKLDPRLTDKTLAVLNCYKDGDNISIKEAEDVVYRLMPKLLNAINSLKAGLQKIENCDDTKGAMKFIAKEELRKVFG